MSEILKIYNKIIFNYTNFPYNDTQYYLKELEYLGLALYLRNITKDKRPLQELKGIIKEEFNIT